MGEGMMGHSWPPLRALPVSPRLVCIILTSSLHLFLSPQLIAFSIQDHGSSSRGKLCIELGDLLAGFNVTYSLPPVFERL